MRRASYSLSGKGPRSSNTVRERLKWARIKRATHCTNVIYLRKQNFVQLLRLNTQRYNLSASYPPPCRKPLSTVGLRSHFGIPLCFKKPSHSIQNGVNPRIQKPLFFDKIKLSLIVNRALTVIKASMYVMITSLKHSISGLHGCCCGLGIAPRAKMLKMSAWLLHPKWWQGSTCRTIVERLHVRKSNVVILTPETVVTVGVWAVAYSCW